MFDELSRTSRLFLLARFSRWRLLSVFSFSTLRHCLTIDVESYIKANADVPPSTRDAYIHFIRHGRFESRSAQPESISNLSTYKGENELEHQDENDNLSRFTHPDYEFLQESLYRRIHRLAEGISWQDAASHLDALSLKGIKLLSLDVWGTLIKRRYHPDSSKHAGIVKLLTLLTDHRESDRKSSITEHRTFDLLSRRLSIEGDLALGKNRNQLTPSEYEIRTVLNCLGHEILSTIPSEQLNASVEIAVQAELRFEALNSLLDSGILNLIKKAKSMGISVVFVTDTYLSSTDIRKLFTLLKPEHTLTVDIHEIPIYASCEVGTSKAWGDLFTFVTESMKVRPQEHLHVGDSLTADIYPQLRNGGKAFYWPDVFTQEKEYGEFSPSTSADQIYEEINFSSLIIRACSERSLSRSETDELLADGRRLGAVVGAWFYWLSNQFRMKSVEKIFFLSREGHRLAELFSMATRSQFKNGTLRGESIRGVHLEVSRLSTFSASLNDGSPEELMRMWRQYSKQTPAALFRSLGLEAGRVSEAILKRFGLQEDAEINEPWRDSALLAFLDSSAFRKIIAEHLKTSRTRLQEYLYTREWPEDWAEVVDIGWRGSIQDNLTRATGTTTNGSYLGLFPHLNPINGTWKNGFAFDIYDFEFHAFIGNKVSVIERLLTPNLRSPRGYGVGGYVHFSELDFFDEVANKRFSAFSQGVDLGCIAMFESLQSNLADGFVARIAARDAIMDFFENPSIATVNLFLSLPHDESFGVGSTHRRTLLETIWPAAHELTS